MADSSEELFAGSRGPVLDFKKGLTRWSKFNDPTYLGFLLLFDWTSPHDPTGSYYLGGGSPLLAGGIDESKAGSNPESWEPPKGTAMDYLKRTEEFTRMKYLNAFINTLKSINYYMPWYWQSIEGLEELWKWKHFEDPYRGGDGALLKIACLESIDLRVTSLIDFYKKACYDFEYRRMIIPENLRKFRVSVYIEEIRKFKVDEGLIGKFNTSVEGALTNLNPESNAYKKISEKTNSISDDSRLQDASNWLADNDAENLRYINGAGSQVMFDLQYCEFETDESSAFLANANMTLPEMASQIIAFKYENVRQESTYPFKYMELENPSGNVGGFNKDEVLDKAKERAKRVVANAALYEAKKLKGRLNGLVLGNVHGFSAGSLQTALTEGTAQGISKEFAEIVSIIKDKEKGELSGTDKAFAVENADTVLTGTDKAYEQEISSANQLSGKDKVYNQESSNPSISGQDNAFG